MQQLMTIKKYAELKAISEVTVRRQIKSGDIQVERFGRAVRVVPNESRADFKNFDLPGYLKDSRERTRASKITSPRKAK